MNKIIFLALILLIPLISAEVIEDTTVTIKIRNNTLELINDEYTGNNKLINLIITNQTIDNLDSSFTIFFIKNETIERSIVEKYSDCLNKKAECEVNLGKFDLAWTQCKKDLEKFEGENSTICKTDLDTCNLKVKEKELEMDNKQTKITALEDDINGTKNTWWIYLAVGLGIASLFWNWKSGKFGGVSEKAQEDFNPQQIG